MRCARGNWQLFLEEGCRGREGGGWQWSGVVVEWLWRTGEGKGKGQCVCVGGHQARLPARGMSHALARNKKIISLLCSESMLEMCVEFAVVSLFALLTDPISPFVSLC